MTDTAQAAARREAAEKYAPESDGYMANHGWEDLSDLREAFEHGWDAHAAQQPTDAEVAAMIARLEKPICKCDWPALNHCHYREAMQERRDLAALLRRLSKPQQPAEPKEVMPMPICSCGKSNAPCIVHGTMQESPVKVSGLNPDTERSEIADELEAMSGSEITHVVTVRPELLRKAAAALRSTPKRITVTEKMVEAGLAKLPRRAPGPHARSSRECVYDILEAALNASREEQQ